MDPAQPDQSGTDSARPQRSRRGNRLLLIGTVAMAAAVGVTVSGVMSANAASTNAVGTDARPAAVSVNATTPKPPPPTSIAQPTSVPAAAPLGSVISTGIKAPGGELVFWVEKLGLPALPEIRFGIMAGLRSPDGHLTPGVETNEIVGPDNSPGFHAIEGAITSNGVPAPEFGYYAGPAVRITGRIGNHVVRAHQAKWSQDPRIVVFWFASSEVKPGQEPTDLTAYNAAGKKLPSGNSAVGHG